MLYRLWNNINVCIKNNNICNTRIQNLFLQWHIFIIIRLLYCHLDKERIPRQLTIKPWKSEMDYLIDMTKRQEKQEKNESFDSVDKIFHAVAFNFKFICKKSCFDYAISFSYILFFVWVFMDTAYPFLPN